MEDLLSCLYAFGGCAAFCVIFEMRRWQFILSAAGIGMVARAACQLLSGISEVFQLLLAAIVTSILAEIFAAREQNTLGISSADLCRNIPGSVYCSTLDKVTEQLRSIAQPGDLILTVGAGDIYRVGEKLLQSEA